ncbi:MAG: hypothetical protein HYX26_05320 [Acidobacteriales bacterium]|nr:hypothetical protein [Terriglobales bacterium]
MKGTNSVETFHSNPNKDFVRHDFDKVLVGDWSQRLGHRLKYLGLPSALMYDIVDWQEYLDRFSTIEREENQQHLMFLKANVSNFEERLHSLYGEFDDILLTGRDRYGHSPQWPYDLVNLDYYGGFIYSNQKRPKAIKKLIQNQATYEQSFLLLITQHLRDGDAGHDQKLTFLQELNHLLKGGVIDTRLHPKIDLITSWYAAPNLPDAARQALYINFFLRDAGESEHFDVACRPPIIYEGTGGTWMIHFATDFAFKRGLACRVASNQTLVEVINMGLLEVRNGAFTPARFVQPRLNGAV